MLVMLDRDGVINHDASQGILSLAQFSFLPRSLDGLVMLAHAGFNVAICTNQSAVSKGLMTLETLHEIHAHLCAAVTQAGGRIDAIYAATDHPDAASPRRKPGCGMLQEALHDFSANAETSFMVGDSLRDLQAAHAAGCPSILVRTGNGAALEVHGITATVAPRYIADDLFAASEYLCAYSARA
jgi:D-glycero-D-manno-heptose 1,7-bisphosphate phosphatase